MAALGMLPRSVAAAPRGASIEIDARAESLIDARAVRRLVQLELADVAVRPAPGQRDTVLFVRVLGAGDGQLRVELWERGVAYGSRAVGGTTGSTQLVARRVALAAAELARELRDEREDAAHAAEQQHRRALEAARVARDRSREGPRALRAAFVGSWLEELALAGTELTGELHVYRSLRLDLGASFLTGAIDSRHAAQSGALSLGPSRRIVLTRGLSLDGGIAARVAVLNFPDVRSVDGIVGQHQTWTAGLDARARLEPRLSRSARLVFGIGGGLTLRDAPVELEVGDFRKIGGFFLSGELGLVLTPF